MMSENVFRFVSMRPPRPLGPNDPRIIDEEEVGEEIIDRVEEKRDENQMTLEEARREVGDEILASQEYYTDDPDWQELRKRLPTFRAACITDDGRAMLHP